MKICDAKKKYFIIGVRILLGALYFIFGLNGFYQFIPVPPMAESATHFIAAVIQTGYLMYFVKSVEVITGLSFLCNRFSPLSAVVAFPITMSLNSLLLWSYRSLYHPMLTLRSC